MVLGVANTFAYSVFSLLVCDFSVLCENHKYLKSIYCNLLESLVFKIKFLIIQNLLLFIV